MSSIAKILLTGRPGIGKTTIVKGVVRCGLTAAGGFVTEEIRAGGRRVGFRVKDIHSGEQGTLARVDRKDGPRVGKYRVDLASFERIGVNALIEAVGRDDPAVVIDEIGKMELCSRAFQAAVIQVFDSGCPALATIPAYRHHLLDQLRDRSDTTLIEATAGNRDLLPQRLIEMLILQR